MTGMPGQKRTGKTNRLKYQEAIHFLTRRQVRQFTRPRNHMPQPAHAVLLVHNQQPRKSRQSNSRTLKPRKAHKPQDSRLTSLRNSILTPRTKTSTESSRTLSGDE